MKKIMIKFVYNDIEYIIYEEDGKFIPCKNEMNNISFKLGKEELDIVNSVFNKIKTTDNKIRLSDVEYGVKKYQHFYDKTNNWNLFLNIDGTDITKEELRYFNNLYNYQDDIMYIGSSENDTNYIKRLVKIGKTTVAALVLSTSLISPLSNLTTVYGKEINSEVVEVIEEDYDELSLYQKIENLKKAINNNKKLKKDEKEFILDKFDIIYDNIDVIDYELVKERFENLDIIYKKGICKSGNIAGEFDGSKITLYSTTSIKDADRTTLIHELFHVVQSHKLVTGIVEPLNDIFVNEYEGIKVKDDFRSYSGAYNNGKPIIYLLMELIGSEPFRIYNFTGDISKIKEGLMNIIDDEAMFYDFLEYFKIYVNSVFDYNSCNSNEAFKLYNIVNKYCKAKTGESMYGNKEFLLSTVQNYKEKLSPIIAENGSLLIEQSKMYFNSKYKESHNESKAFYYENHISKCLVAKYDVNNNLYYSECYYFVPVKRDVMDNLTKEKRKEIKNELKYITELNDCISSLKTIDIDENLKIYSYYKDSINFIVPIDESKITKDTEYVYYNDQYWKFIDIDDNENLIRYLHLNRLNKKYGKEYEEINYELNDNNLKIIGESRTYNVDIEEKTITKINNENMVKQLKK